VSAGGYAGPSGTAKEFKKSEVVRIGRWRKLHVQELHNSCPSLVLIDGLHEKEDDQFHLLRRNALYSVIFNQRFGATYRLRLKG
jgi:hypothetical protein